ncbi:hypothetical protein AVEN_205596-1 [Araneus ventricosus]|uniref:Uncharacterized protein n=1 Tax=Araneus ventricosus TaxID=182803 RepID=A0A4Y2F9L4_ARAVE|nr:hypothetical protein AVEN_205596-1 [Araneus ventricosus]
MNASGTPAEKNRSTLRCKGCSSVSIKDRMKKFQRPPSKVQNPAPPSLQKPPVITIGIHQKRRKLPPIDRRPPRIPSPDEMPLLSSSICKILHSSVWKMFCNNFSTVAIKQLHRQEADLRSVKIDIFNTSHFLLTTTSDIIS